MGLRVSVLLPKITPQHCKSSIPDRKLCFASPTRSHAHQHDEKNTCERLRAISHVRCTPMGMDNYKPRQATQCASPSQTAPHGRMEHDGRTRAPKGLQGGLTTKRS
jgi:hypothetical protein